MDKNTEKKRRRKAVEGQMEKEGLLIRARIEKQRKQIEETNEQLRKQLQELADAEAKLKAQLQLMEDAEKPRTFAEPTSSDEAEIDAPSAEVRAEGFSFKTQEEVLKSGTLREKMRLYFCYLDDDSYFDNNSRLSPKDVAKIKTSIKTDKDRKEVEHYYKEYLTLKRYGASLRFYFKRFQTSFSFLAKELYRLDSYEDKVKTYNTILQIILSIQSTDTDRMRAIDKLAETAGECILFDRDRMEFSLSLAQGELLSNIQKEAKEVEEDLADFKAYAVVAEEYCEKSKLKYLPISIQMCIENAEEERYIRYLIENRNYFKSELNDRKSKGEKVSEEEYQKAFIPDYYEVEPSEDVLKDCNNGIKKIEKSMRL